MRLRIDTSAPVDLGFPVLLAVGSIVAYVLEAPAWVLVPVGLAAVLLAPGYSLVAFLFPRRIVVIQKGIERRPLSPLGWFGLALALSMALGALVGLVLNFVDGGLNAAAFLTVNSVLVAVFCAGAMVRRANAPLEERFRLHVDWAFTWEGRGGHDVALVVLFALSVLLIGGAVAYSILEDEPRERFTEFYVLGSDGTAACYPRAYGPTGYTVAAPQSCPGLGNLTLGVANHEGRSMHYWLRAVWTNETLSPPSVLGAQEISTQEFDLPHVPFDLRLGQNFTPQHEIPFQMPPPPGNGTWRLSFQLYTSPPPPVEPTQSFLETPLRRLHILIVAP